jgi:hypothetical protein
VPVLFVLGINVKPDILSKSPTTKLVYRTQQYGADNGAMYQGDAIAAGRARVDQCIDNWRLNPADFYSADNEPGRSDAVGLQWLCDYNIGQMQRADELGVKLGIVAWSTGMPPLTPELIALYLHMLRYAMAHGHILLLHEYSLNGPMIGNPLCLRYRQLYAALPADARPQLVISEAGPDAGYGMGYTGQAYIDVVAAYDVETWKDEYLIGVALYALKHGESNMADVIPLLTDYVVDHPTPIAPPPDDNPSDSGTFSAYKIDLIDDRTNVWSLAMPHNPDAGYAVLKNGVQFGGGYAEALLYYQGAIYCTNRSTDKKGADWYRADATAWTRVRL